MKKFYQTFCRVEEIICGAAFISLVSLIFLSAILRSMSMSLSWNIDAALLLLAWSAFLGADCAFRSGQLVGIDIFTRNLPPKTKKIIEIAVLIFILILLLIFAVFGIILVVSDWGRQYNSLPISFSWAVLSLPVATFSMSISAILKIKNALQEFNN